MTVDRRLDGLTSLRFFACLWVVLFHYGQFQTGRVPILGGLVRQGYLGVSFFFVLSGFVLTAVYAPRVRREPLDRRAFYVARFARIYPVYLVATLLAIVPFLLHVRQESPHASLPAALLPALALRLSMLSAWIPGYALRLNPPAWTLSVETFFYLAFPFILPWLLRGRASARLGVALPLILVSCLVPFFLQRIHPGNGIDAPYRVAEFFPLSNLGSFLVGCEAGLLFVDRRASDAKGKRVLNLSLALSLLVLALCFGFDRVLPSALLHNGLLAVPFAAVALWTAENEDRLRLLRLPLLVLLGEASYSAYLFQESLIDVGNFLAAKIGLASPTVGTLSLLLFLLALGGFSVACYRFFEAPMRRLLRARLEPKGSREGGTTASGILVDKV